MQRETQVCGEGVCPSHRERGLLGDTSEGNATPDQAEQRHTFLRDRRFAEMGQIM